MAACCPVSGPPGHWPAGPLDHGQPGDISAEAVCEPWGRRSRGTGRCPAQQAGELVRAGRWQTVSEGTGGKTGSDVVGTGSEMRIRHPSVAPVP